MALSAKTMAAILRGNIPEWQTYSSIRAQSIAQAIVDSLQRTQNVPGTEVYTIVGVIESEPQITHEDRGAAMIAEVDDDIAQWCVRIQSYDETPGAHHWIEEQIRGKRVRVTVEVVEIVQ